MFAPTRVGSSPIRKCRSGREVIAGQATTVIGVLPFPRRRGTPGADESAVPFRSPLSERGIDDDVLGTDAEPRTDQSPPSDGLSVRRRRRRHHQPHQALAYLQDASEKTGVTAEEWNPETINALAGTLEVDTAGDLHALVPEIDRRRRSQYWNVGPTEASPEITKDLYQEFLDSFALYYPNITLDNQNIGYNDMLDKIRTAAAGGAAPDVAKMPILWGVEFAARGDTSPRSPSRSSA